MWRPLWRAAVTIPPVVVVNENIAGFVVVTAENGGAGMYTMGEPPSASHRDVAELLAEDIDAPVAVALPPVMVYFCRKRWTLSLAPVEEGDAVIIR